MHWFLELLGDTAKEATLFTILGSAISLVGMIEFGGPFFDYLGLVLLLEATVLMLIGGAMEIGGTASAKVISNQLRSLFGLKKLIGREESKQWSKEEYKATQLSAARYSLTGVILFLESLLLALTNI